MIEKRREAVNKTVGSIRNVLANGVTVESLNQAKVMLMNLAAQSSLFTLADFPVPSEQDIERTDLIHEEPDGSYALYVNSSRPGQQSRPHDHGGAWAIVAAINGEEEHRVYLAKNTRGTARNKIEQTGVVVVKPGTAISILPDGIHSIHAVSNSPLQHLHLYAKAFRFQGERKEYDLSKGTVRKFVLDDLGFIEDRR